MKAFDKLVLGDQAKLFNMGTIIEILVKPNKKAKLGYQSTGTIMSQIICCTTLRESIDEEYTEIQGDGTLYLDDFGQINFCPSCGKKVHIKIRMISK